MKSAAYLSAARTSSLFMLVAVAVGYQVSSSYARDASFLLASRQAFATKYVQDALDGRPNAPLAPRPTPVAGVGTVSVERRREEGSPGQRVIWFGVSVQTEDGRGWGTRVAYRVDPDSSATNEPMRTLHRVARAFGVTGLENQDYTDLFVAIEREWATREVRVPGIELAFRPLAAPWIIMTVTIILLVLIDNYLRTVLVDTDLALDEPWLVLDAERRLEKVVAAIWLLAIGLAPWLAGGSTMIMFANQLEAFGSIANLPRSLLAFAVVLAALMTGGWASTSVVNDLLRLRRLRLLKRSSGRGPRIPSGTREANDQC